MKLRVKPTTEKDCDGRIVEAIVVERYNLCFWVCGFHKAVHLRFKETDDEGSFREIPPWDHRLTLEKIRQQYSHIQRMQFDRTGLAMYAKALLAIWEMSVPECPVPNPEKGDLPSDHYAIPA